MHSTVLHKRSTTPGNTPASSILSAGEIALNIADGKIFIKATDNSVKTFLNSEQSPYTLDQTLSSVNYQYGSNTVTEILGGVLGGLSNSVSGAGSTIINGSDNDIAADYAIIGNGSNNEIASGGDYGAILGGVNNTLSHAESFILGSNITSHLSGFTYVNNLTAVGKIYGDGSELTGIVAGDTEATTLVRQQSATWGTGGTAQTLSFNEGTKDLSISPGGNTVSLSAFGSGADVEVRALTADWEIAYDIATAYSAASSTFLTSETDSQTLSFDESTKNLSISNGNTVSLSAFGTGADTEVRSLSASWQNTFTDFSTNSASYATNSTVNSVSSQLLLNLDFDSYKTNVASATATLLPITVYQSASGVWQDTTTVVQANSAQWAIDSTLDADVRALTANWIGGNDAYTNLISNSAAYLSSVDLTFLSVSADWNSVYNTVQSNSATNWNYQGSDLKALSGNWQNTYTNYSANSASYATISTVNSVSSQLVLTTDFNSYKTNVTSATATLLPTTVYQSASANWQNSYTTVQSNSANWAGGSSGAVLNGGGAQTLKVLTQAQYNAISVPDSNTVYVITP